jgi:hypothetical protein
MSSSTKSNPSTLTPHTVRKSIAASGMPTAQPPPPSPTPPWLLLLASGGRLARSDRQ